MTIEQRLELASEYLCMLLKLNAPKDTWNLTINGIHRVNNAGIWEIVIGGETAPYAVYTNEPWNHGTKPNPNQNWIGDTIEQAKPMLVALLSGSYTEEDIESVKKKTVAATNLLKIRQELAAIN